MSAGDALERWRAQLNVTSEQEPPEAPIGAQDGGQDDTEMEAPEYEYLNEAEARQRGDQQALAPATEEQAAGGHLPDRDATAEADDAVDLEDDVMEDAPPAPQQEADKVIYIFQSLPSRISVHSGCKLCFSFRRCPAKTLHSYMHHSKASSFQRKWLLSRST